MKRFIFLWLVVAALFSDIQAAGTPLLSHETFDHIGVPGAMPALTNSASDNYPDTQKRLNHPVVVVAPTPVQVRLGRFTTMPPAPWDVHMPFAGVAPPPMNLLNINRMIARRLAHGVVISPALIANLGAANAAGAITAQLTASLRAGGYLNNMSAIVNRLTLIGFPLGTILGVVPAFIPDSIVVHIALPRRVSRNLNELSHSSVATGAVGGLTLRDKINAPFAFLVGVVPLPDSVTIVSSNQLQ